MSQLIKKWEDIDNLPIPASTLFGEGNFISYDGSGSVIPSTRGKAIVGVNLLTVAATDSDYASATKQTFFQKAGSVGQYTFSVPVGAGTALASMIGSVFNVYASDAGKIDLSAYSTLTYNTLAVGVFVVGETITGGTSGATGVITVTHTVGGSQQLVFTVTAGTFVAGETITGGTSSATAKILTVFTGGTQLKVEKVLSTTLVECSVALPA